MRAALPFTFLMLSLAPALAQQAPSPVAPPRIVVTGEGEATARPDLATLSLSVMREAKTAKEALDANSSAMASVITAMKAEEIAETDLQTSGFNIQPRYVYPNNQDGNQEPKLVAYQVTNTLGVRVRDLAKLGEILDKAVSLGVNQGGDIAFGAVDQAKPLAEARKKAVQDAMARAKALADAAGITLGRIVEINETSPVEPPRPMMKAFDARAAAAPASVPVEAGENAYRIQVTVTFAIER